MDSDFRNFYGILMEGDPSNENDYKRALDERVKEYMKFFMKMKEILGEEEEREN